MGIDLYLVLHWFVVYILLVGIGPCTTYYLCKVLGNHMIVAFTSSTIPLIPTPFKQNPSSTQESDLKSSKPPEIETFHQHFPNLHPQRCAIQQSAAYIFAAIRQRRDARDKGGRQEKRAPKMRGDSSAHGKRE